MSDQTEVMERRPQGSRVEGTYGPGKLRPDIGKQVRRSGVPEYCGAMIGRVVGYEEHPNQMDATKVSCKFFGQFINIDHAGVTHNCNAEYLPPVIGRTIKAALDLQSGTTDKSPINFAVEVWCEPDENPKNTIGFKYAVFDRVQKNEHDPLLMLAYETGLIARPALPAPEPAHDNSATSSEEIDPETGEITRKPSRRKAA